MEVKIPFFAKRLAWALGIRKASQKKGKVVGQPVPDNAQYWCDVNVTEHKPFKSAAESLEYFHWRNTQYHNYIELMPVAGQDGKVVLDYGCGPGNDLVGFSAYSKPSRLVGMDISLRSVAEANAVWPCILDRAEVIPITERTTIGCRSPTARSITSILPASCIMRPTRPRCCAIRPRPQTIGQVPNYDLQLRQHLAAPLGGIRQDIRGKRLPRP